MFLPQTKPQQFWLPEISHQLPLLRMIRPCKLFSLFPTNSKSKLASQQQLNEQQEQIDMLRHLPTIRPFSQQVSASAKHPRGQPRSHLLIISAGVLNLQHQHTLPTHCPFAVICVMVSIICNLIV